jgi:hypothetical protein
MDLPGIPRWLERALQGLTFWVGHRRYLYGGYPLGESAFVAELCNLIYTHLPDAYVLKCEVQYTELVAAGAVETNVLTARARADIVIAEKVDGKREGAIPRFVIEVKRASAPTAQITHDLKRLAAVKSAHGNIKTFLVIVAEASRPKKFTTDDGWSALGWRDIPNSTLNYRVRRTVKAAHAFTNPDTAQYACLLEVDSRPSRRRGAQAKG